MEEMRFGQPNRGFPPPHAEFEKGDAKKSKISPKFWPVAKKILMAVFGVAILSTIVWGGVYFWDKKSGSSINYDPSASEYYAVFLTSGQVYFGKLSKRGAEEIMLSDVYYLQASENANAQEQLAQPRFSLVKLGQEIHGPTDRMFINYDQVLFYEQLKKDSKVVESIKNDQSR